MASGAGAIRAGRAFVELLVGDKGLRSGLDKAGKTLKGWGDGVNAAGLKLAAVGGAIAAPLLAASHVFAEMGDELAKSAARTGIAVEALSGLKYAADQSGTSLSELEGGLRKMSKLIVEAAQGGDQAKQTLDDLGVKLEDLKGMTPDQQFSKLADAIAAVENPTARAAMVMDVFGKSGGQLLPLLSDGAKGIKALTDRAAELGLTWSTEDAKGAEEFGDRLDDLTSVLKRAVATIGGAVAPILQRVAVYLTDAAVKAGAWISANREMFATALKVAAGVAAAAGGLLTMGLALKTVGFALGGISSALGLFGSVAGVLGTVLRTVLTSSIGFVIAGLAGLALYLAYNTEVGKKMLGALGEYFGQLKATATTAIGGITDALSAGDFKLAAEVLWAGLRAAWLAGIKPLTDVWENFKAKFVTVAVGAFSGMLAAWDIARNFLTESWIKTVATLSSVWAKFQASVESGWDNVTEVVSGVMIEGPWNSADDKVKMRALNEQQSADAQKDIADRRDASLKATADASSAELAAEAKRHAERMGAIGKEFNEMKEGADAAAEAEKAAAAQGVKDAQDKLNALRAKAKDLAGGPLTTSPDLPPKPKVPTPEELAAGLDGLQRKTTQRGTFNSAALGGLAGGGQVDRIVKATEQTAKNTKPKPEKKGLFY
jgi:hypothetical protein